MRYGFVLDQTRCIGCHACTVACKSENDVPLGAFRTWVKVIDRGAFPLARRHFAVLRCNQCDDAPCVTICPTRALFRRDDGIVDFDSDACIGCKSCMQACPYDALYIDPATQTAAKCNFCSHRVDAGLQPACQIVCPTQAIISGDLDDPDSPVSRIVAQRPVQVRKPDQGTRPKVFYVGADETLLDPRTERASSPLFTDPGPRGTADPDAGLDREVYDVSHEAPWGWKVWLYLWTKSIAAGAAGVAAALALTRGDPATLWPPVLGLAFTLATAALLVFDLKRPGRFWYLLTRPNFRSWLVWGGYILGAFGLFCACWLAGALAGVRSWPAAFHGGALVLAVLAAGYTAFLFNQAEGRDFWQSPLLLPHLLAEAALCGSAVLLVVGAGPPPAWLACSAAAHLGVILLELSERHGNADVRRAALHLRSRRSFLWVVVVLGTLVPLLLLIWRAWGGPAGAPVAAGLLCLAGALEYGRLWIEAGQSVKLS